MNVHKLLEKFSILTNEKRNRALLTDNPIRTQCWIESNASQCRLFSLAIQMSASLFSYAHKHNHMWNDNTRAWQKQLIDWQIDEAQRLRTATSVSQRFKQFCFFSFLFSFQTIFFKYFQALAGLVEIPAIALAIIIIMYVGKKWILFSTMFCAGISCLCITFVSENPEIQYLKITFIMLGNLTIWLQEFLFVCA